MNIFFRQFEDLFNNITPSWMHISGGFAVCYVFLYLLPKTAYLSNHSALQAQDFPYLGSTITFFFMMLGSVTYWLVDLDSTIKEDTVRRSKGHIAGLMLYNTLVGYVIATTVSTTLLALPVATIAMVFHLAGLNHLIKHWAPQTFHTHYRWLLTLALFIGGAIGLYSHLPTWAIAFLTAFTGGAILINVVCYELPRHTKDSIKPFLIGVGGFTAFCLLIRYIHYAYQ